MLLWHFHRVNCVLMGISLEWERMFVMGKCPETIATRRTIEKKELTRQLSLLGNKETVRAKKIMELAALKNCMD